MPGHPPARPSLPGGSFTRLVRGNALVTIHVGAPAAATWQTCRYQSVGSGLDYFRLADYTPSGEPISRGCECNGEFRQVASGSKALCILASVM